MLRTLIITAALAVATAVFALAGPASAGNAPTVIRGHFEYDLFDPDINQLVHFSCDEVRLETTGGARETIHCKTTDTTHKSAVIFSPENLFSGVYPWSSDFTGQEARDWHLTGTPAGTFEGWAIY